MSEINKDLTEARRRIENIKSEVSSVIIGQQDTVDLLLKGLLGSGNVLIEGAPGLAKTLIAKLLASLLDLKFSRIQFTPDLMPSDIIGTSVFNFKNSDFEFRKGPVFANFVLADEINRAPAKTQAALFEAMEEKQVSTDRQTYIFEPPFFVIATQNPIDMEGTYRLPEAQMDRFMFKIVVGYPSLEEEQLILQAQNKRDIMTAAAEKKPVMTREELVSLMRSIFTIKAEDKIIKYIAEIVHKTRNSRHISVGASPRASLSILNGAKAGAIMAGREFVTPDDVKEVAVPALEHRIILTPEREMEGVTERRVVEEVLRQVEVPR